ncbi:MAG: P1 family peptidase [Aminobacteriaceae bacterium]|jgi:D-aminopeptidase|uniref:DmpA family aminopeptidase n=1 Tax=Aminivibrio sp. TaxID=1872489 RepID=UPI002B20569B|nr:P1 family peptidase [Aminivibrio sp.]MEA4952231.1 P1 family peptidase [Aminivibrio sp.]
MDFRKRITDYGIKPGILPRGPRNAITDVEGVRVGHCTLADGPVQTGVTAVLPHGGNLFREKLLAACHVINGFGKSAGLVQVEEMGTLETPVILTNTFAVGAASEALVRYMLADNPDIGRETGTVNPVVCECNDGFLNDIRGFAVREEHVLRALASASEDFEEGAVGAGRGMSCHQLKGGIGTASRILEAEGASFTLGVLVLSNYGQLEDLRVDGRHIGPAIGKIHPPQDEQGSIIAVIATDIPLTERQLRRVARRATVGITRTGAFIGSGSGEIALAFTTANRFRHHETAPLVTLSMLNENHINLAFRAAAEATEEAVLNSMAGAEPVSGRDGHIRHSLAEYAHLFARQ